MQHQYRYILLMSGLIFNEKVELIIRDTVSNLEK